MILGVSVAVAVACLLYLWRLHDTPIAIGGDEAFFANHGLSLAQTGKDRNGRLLPLVIQVDPDTDTNLWYQAMLVYLQAAAFLVLPFAEWSARLPVALIAITNVALAWAVAVRYTRSAAAGPVAAMVLALSPIHFFLSRQALDYTFPITFVLLWLWALAAMHDTKRPRDALLCGLVLGLGLFSYIASWMMMPVYLLVTLIVCLVQPARWRLGGMAALGFALPAGALALWLMAHPEALSGLLGRYKVGTAQIPGVNINTFYRVVDLVTAYWSSWNPAHLFLIGSPNPTIGVRTGGVFVAPVVVFFVAGLIAAARHAGLHLVLLAGLVTAPIGPVLYGTPGAIQRQLVLLPFFAIISGLGAVHLWSHRRWPVRLSASLVAAACPAVFAIACYDVFATRDSYATRFDPSNLRTVEPAMAELDRQRPAPKVVLAIGPYDRRAYWFFHTQKNDHLALLRKTAFVEPDQVRIAELVADSLIVVSAPSGLATELDRACTRVAVFRGEAEVVVWRAGGPGCGMPP